MSAASAGGMLMWLAGALLGVGVAIVDLSSISVGAMLSVLGVVYISRFAEKS